MCVTSLWLSWEPVRNNLPTETEDGNHKRTWLFDVSPPTVDLLPVTNF